MARPGSKHPTELELEILKILWREGPLNVRQVRDALADYRDLAITSVTTIMNIMAEKKYLKRGKQGGAFVYQPRVLQKTVARQMLGDIVDRVFEGSAASVMLNLLEESDIDPKELKQLREILRHKEEEEQS